MKKKKKITNPNCLVNSTSLNSLKETSEKRNKKRVLKSKKNKEVKENNNFLGADIGNGLFN